MNTPRIGSLPRRCSLGRLRLLRFLLLACLLERPYCVADEGCPRFYLKEDALESWILLNLLITLPIETHVNLSVSGAHLTEHFRILSVRNLEILER